MLNEEVVKELSALLLEKYGLATTTQLDRAVADILAKSDLRQSVPEATGSRCRE